MFIYSDFQKIAMKSIEEGNHTLITAHTGSGKTMPAEYAIEYFIKKGKKVIYTAPIKALSNQKYNDFTKKFPEIHFGLLTGDNKHNPSANVLIMTTEILQNNLFHLYTNNTKTNESITKSHLDFDMDIDNDLACVIFDEIHYIDDPERGSVWEHCIMMLPNNIQFVMLSATIGEKEKFAGWIERIKQKKVVLCGTNERVVPLTFYSFFTAHNKAIEKLSVTNKLFIESKINKLEVIKNNSYYESIISQNKKCIQLIKDETIHRKYVINEVCKVMRQKEMFPALFFVFSRKNVETIANEITFPLFEENEKDYEIEHICKQLLVSRVTNWKEYILLPEYTKYIQLLNKGIGIHHAGMLPIYREMIEILYSQKYIKVLIATETFAIGLNMPTKTVCFTSLYKHDGKLRNLHSHEFIQMSGRAGRRNIDTIGNVILLTNLYEPLDTNLYYRIMNSEPKVLKSKFKIGYDLILQMICKSKEEIKQYIEKSMMNEDIMNDIIYTNNKINLLEEELNSQYIEQQYVYICERYLQLKDDLTISKNKIRRQISNEILTIEQNKDFSYNLNIFTKIKELENDIFSQKNYKYYCETYIEHKINCIYGVLAENKFINEQNTEIITNNLSDKGIIASSVHEIHPLVFTDLYTRYKGFSHLSSTQIFCLFSCFYPVKEEDMSPPFLKNELLYVKERIEYYNEQDVKYDISIYPVKIQYSIMEYIREWMDECDDDIKSVHLLVKMKGTVFCGDFIKCCLKIINICKEVEPFVCCELKEKLNEGKDKLMKFICTNQSLYL
uniref:Helicase n=1 Tax=viral metagenome TaxID=1070528 RepID=A0A6C0EU83_9ZZZZ